MDGRPGIEPRHHKFVYNPSSGKDALVASFSKGALRFVGGKLSKNDPGVKVNTPHGRRQVIQLKLRGNRLVAPRKRTGA